VKQNTQPITPSQIRQERMDSIPDAVIRAVNTLLRNGMSDRYRTVRFRQSELTAAIIEELMADGMFDSCMPSEADMEERGWFKLKSLFETADWKVYWQPSQNGSPIFRFEEAAL